MSTSAQPEATTRIRPSASLVIVNARNEVLLVQRNPRARSFGGMTVFPGGNYDAGQDCRSFRMTAIRETFEESGLLLASPTLRSPAWSHPLLDAALDNARRSILAGQTLFPTFLKEHGLEADESSLLPFTEWITPTTAPRRFHARFFVAFLPDMASAGFSSGDKQERIPTPDGGQEVISARFVHPADALDEFRAQKITFMPPQFYILSTLAELLHGRANSAIQRERTAALARGAFGRMVINPRRAPELDADAGGRAVLSFEGDETRRGSPGRLHRVLVTSGKDGFPVAMALQRNFDVFTEIEPQAFSPSSRM